ncbi:hypothetical protein [Clostridium tyrobutyricum]|uniref:hypothetical protein n=1 Tax=Clostridium tyrobutyricum TaxID=1519 RepID=UPI001C38A8A3|nr:hypothetical protein [Clostridium tyrobutyricum]MBV4423442.1 hypothetical protein [Clostridium tyrobutyricum]
MWVRSQDKYSLVKANRLLIVETAYVAKFNKGYRIINQYKCTNDSDDYDILGEYETEKRALEVLDNMQIQIESCTEFTQTKEFVSKLEGRNSTTRQPVYQMPEE